MMPTFISKSQLGYITPAPLEMIIPVEIPPIGFATYYATSMKKNHQRSHSHRKNKPHKSHHHKTQSEKNLLYYATHQLIQLGSKRSVQERGQEEQVTREDDTSIANDVWFTL